MNVTPLSGQWPGPGDIAQPLDKISSRSTEVGAKQDHYSVLARMLAEASQDQAQLRSFIYEFARVKLRKELYPRFVEGAWSEIEEQMRGLETAIDRIEADFAQNAPPLQYESPPALSERTQEQTTTSLLVPRFGSQKTATFGDDAIRARSLLLGSSTYGASALPSVSNVDGHLANAFLGTHLRSTFWRNTQIILAATIGVAMYAAADTQSVFNRFGLSWPNKSMQINVTGEVEKQQDVAPRGKALTPISSEALRPRANDIPIPNEYGAYAVINGKLTELGQLPIKVPDPRVAISAAISTPSQTHLPTGQFQFVVFRRDLTNSVPDHVSVRVMAQVMRALTFDTGGHAKMTDVEQSWVIRSNSYQMRVAPFGDNPEMVVIRSNQADFVLPAGRYALVLKGVGYDFTVDGEMTDLAHCLERTDALNAQVYSECRKL